MVSIARPARHLHVHLRQTLTRRTRGRGDVEHRPGARQDDSDEHPRTHLRLAAQRLRSSVPTQQVAHGHLTGAGQHTQRASDRRHHQARIGERRQVDFRVDTSRKTMTEEIEVKVRNQKKERVTVQVKENLYRWVNWNITARSQDFRKEDARTVHFPVRIAPKGEAVVRYTVRYTW